MPTSLPSVSIVAFALLSTLTIALTRPRLPVVGRLGPAHGAVFGVLIVLLTGIVQLEVLYDTAVELARPFLTITAIMVLSGAARRVRVLRMLARLAFSGEPTARRLFDRVFLLSACVSSVLNNDAMVLLLTPLVVDLAAELWPRRTDVRVAFAFAVFSAVGVAPLVVANPMNLVVADQAGIGFNAYLVRMGPAALACWISTWGVLRLIFHRTLSDAGEPAVTAAAPELTPPRRRMLILLGLVVLAYPLASAFDDRAVTVVAVLGAVGALAIASAAAPVREVLARDVEWDILIFLLGVFVLAVGMQEVGVVDLMASLYTVTGPVGVLGGAAMGSALINNHPVAILNLLALEQVPWAGQREILMALAGGDIGPRLLPNGSLAGLLWLAACRRSGLVVSVRAFVVLGVATSVPALAAAGVVLWWLA